MVHLSSTSGNINHQTFCLSSESRVNLPYQAGEPRCLSGEMTSREDLCTVDIAGISGGCRVPETVEQGSQPMRDGWICEDDEDDDSSIADKTCQVRPRIHEKAVSQ
jgi:hypothetical protein